MRIPKKFNLVLGVNDKGLIKKQILGYDVQMPLAKLAIYTTIHGAGWYVVDKRTGVTLGSQAACDSEETAISIFMGTVNNMGEDVIQKQIDDLIEQSTPKPKAETPVVLPESDAVSKTERPDLISVTEK